MIRSALLATACMLMAQSLISMPYTRLPSRVSPTVVQKINKALVDSRPDLVLLHLHNNGLGLNTQLNDQRENVFHLIAKLEDDKTSAKILQSLLITDNDARLYEPDRDGRTPLDYAYDLEKEQLSTQLRAYADEDAYPKRNMLGETDDLLVRFRSALQTRDISLAARLLKDMVGMNGMDEKGWTPLMFAVLARDWDMVSQLIKDGADLFAGHNQNALDVAKMMKGDNLSRLVNIFVEKHGANGVVHTYGRTIPLIVMAWAMGYKEVERLLVEHGAEPMHTDKFWQSIKELNYTDSKRWLKYKLKSNGTQLIDDLVDSGAINLPLGRRGITLLQFAAQEGLTEIVRLLVANGADVNVQDRQGWTALFHVAGKFRHSNINIAKLLLNNGADPNIVDSNRMTALMWAVQILLDKAAYTDLRDLFVLPPLFYAAKKLVGRLKKFGNRNIVKILLDMGANPNLVGRRGDTALALAVYGGDMDMVKLLLDNGADPNIVVRGGYTAYTYAVDRGMTKIAYLLDKAATKMKQ